MQPIVDFRLGDVYRARSSSRLIYAGSRHDPGCVRRSDGAGQQGGVAGVESRRVFGAVSHLRRVLIHDQTDLDAISSQLLRYRDGRGDDWADIIDMLTLHPEARRRVVRMLGEMSVGGEG